MNRRDFLKVAGTGLAVGALARPAFAATTIPVNLPFNNISKSLWVWQTSLVGAASVIALAKTYGFDTVFFSIPLADRQTLFSEAGTGVMTTHLKAFRQNGIAFCAVSGEPVWCLDAEKNPAFLPADVADLVAYQQRTGLFDGMCFDIEPWVLPQWTQCTGSACHADPALIGMLKGYLAVLQNITKSYNLISGANAFPKPLAATMLPILVERPDPDQKAIDLLVAAATSINGARQGIPVLLAYESSPTRAVNYGHQAMIELTDTVRGQWWFGQTVHPNPVPGVSYSAATFTQLEADMIQLDQDITATYGVPSPAGPYLGVAINDYLSLNRIIVSRP